MMKKIVVISLFALMLLQASVVLGASFEVNYLPLGPAGETPTPGGGPAGWVRYIFFFALFATGLAAVGNLIYAGIVWATSGATGKVGDAQDRIKSAIIGIVIVAGSVLILNIINPDLTKLQNPDVRYFNSDFNYESTFGNPCISDSQCGFQEYCHSEQKKCLYSFTGEGGVGQSCANNANACREDLFCDNDTQTCQKTTGNGGDLTPGATAWFPSPATCRSNGGEVVNDNQCTGEKRLGYVCCRGSQ